MNTFVDKNRKRLEFYSTASRILGWVIIVFVCVAFVAMTAAGRQMAWRIPEERKTFFLLLGTVTERTFDWLPKGIILLGIGQILKYICVDGYKMPWLLRNGTKVLYLFAVLAFLRPFIFAAYHQMMRYNFQVNIITSIFFLVANVLILIGLADIYKRVLPIIEEHKSLV